MEAPENTLPAYIKAWEQGVDAVELDVRETKDKRLICIHDDALRESVKANIQSRKKLLLL